jgi:hypothetical protein
MIVVYYFYEKHSYCTHLRCSSSEAIDVFHSAWTRQDPIHTDLALHFNAPGAVQHFARTV